MSNVELAGGRSELVASVRASRAQSPAARLVCAVAIVRDVGALLCLNRSFESPGALAGLKRLE
jgi:hypothetical protein